MPLSDKRSVVASWKIILPEGNFFIEFEHGSTSGKRVLWINGKEILRKDWMFRLVGSEHFQLGRFHCKLNVEPDGTFGLLYSLFINGLEVEEFNVSNRKRWIIWILEVKTGTKENIIFEKDTMDVWLNGTKVDCEVQFIDGGNLTIFNVDGTPVTIKSLSSGNKKQGIIHECIVDGQIIQPDTHEK